MFTDLFSQIAILILAATLAGFVARILKQPAIPFYIIAGLIIGPILGVFHNISNIQQIAEIGIAFLLFLVGIEVNFSKLKEVAKFSVITAIITTVLTAVVGYFLAMKIGFTQIEAVVLGFVFALSSTSIVLKILTDKKELDTLHGRILITILLVQDIFAIVFLVIISTVKNTMSIDSLFFLKILLVILLIYAFYKWIIPYIIKLSSKSIELLFLTSLSICFLFGFLFHWAGFSIAIGAFAAGLAISPSIYKYEILSRIKPIRDFFAIIFFVSLGLIVSKHFANWPIIIYLTIFVIVIKPIIIMLLTFFAGYRKRTSFAVSTSLGQASEFSLIIAISAFTYGLVNQNVLNITAVVSIISIVVSSYFISERFDNYLYNFFSKYLSIFEIGRKNQKIVFTDKKKRSLRNHVILIGADRVGSEIAQTLKEKNKRFIVVDFNPTVIRKLKRDKINSIFGDIDDAEIQEKAGFDDAKMIISTIPNIDINQMLLKKTKLIGKHPVIYTTAQTVDDALTLYKMGSDYVIVPQLLGGSHVSRMLNETENKLERFLELKEKHLRDLKKRKRDEELFA